MILFRPEQFNPELNYCVVYLRPRRGDILYYRRVMGRVPDTRNLPAWIGLIVEDGMYPSWLRTGKPWVFLGTGSGPSGLVRPLSDEERGAVIVDLFRYPDVEYTFWEGV